MAELLMFPKRGRVYETSVARRTVWLSRCGGYRVVRSHYTVGGSNSYADVFYAEAASGSGWQIISRHRKRRAAERACQRHARQQARQKTQRRADNPAAEPVTGAIRQRLLFGEIEPPPRRTRPKR